MTEVMLNGVNSEVQLNPDSAQLFLGKDANAHEITVVVVDALRSATSKAWEPEQPSRMFARDLGILYRYI